MKDIDLNIKISDDEEELFRIKIDDSKVNEGIIIFDLLDVKDGTHVFKFQFEDNNLIILDNPMNIEVDIPRLHEKFEELLVQENPNQQFGTEQTEVEDEVEVPPYDPEKIRVDTKPFSLHQIKEMIDRNDINLTPDFQRNLVWDSKRKCRLIESILMRIPLPMFYFAQDDEGRISVVDGLQRLSCIRDFMDNKLRLKDLEYLEEKCGGKYYCDKDKDGKPNGKKPIDAKYYRWFNMTQIIVNVIDPSSPFKLKYDIFRRINTGGQPLNSQEIRNCLSSDSLRIALHTMAKSESFVLATGQSVKDVRMEAQELALRFIMFHKKYSADKLLDNYSGNIESELNTLTDQLSRDKTFDYTYYIKLYDKAMRNAYHLFGKYSFRKCKLEHVHPGAHRQLINKALFVSWSVILSQYDSDQIENDLNFESMALPLAQKISEDQKLLLLLTYSTNSKLNIQAAFKVAEDLLIENLK